MAKKTTPKKKPNKSALIQRALTRDPNASPKAVAEALNSQGIKVTPAYVSTIKTLFRKSSGTVRGRNGKSRAARDMVSMAHLKELKQLVDNIGSIDQTREMLRILDELK